MHYVLAFANRHLNFKRPRCYLIEGFSCFDKGLRRHRHWGLNGFAEELAGEWNAIHQECLPLEIWSRLIGPFRLRNIIPHKKAESGQECYGGGQKHAEANYQNLIYTNVPRMDSFNILTSSSIPYW
jgi:hypothetical protein